MSNLNDRIPFMLHIPQALLSSLEADARLVKRSTNAHILRILESNTDVEYTTHTHSKEDEEIIEAELRRREP